MPISGTFVADFSKFNTAVEQAETKLISFQTDANKVATSLGRMEEAGYLVAAGPLPDEPGAGLTVLRLPGAGQAEKARKLATEDDQSVVDGLLAVTVRPWQVLLRA